MTPILATSISDITSQYVCITHLHSNLDYANGKLRSFLPHDFDRFLLAKQVESKITDSVYKCRLITIQTTVVIVILFFTSVSLPGRRLKLKRRSTLNVTDLTVQWGETVDEHNADGGDTHRRHRRNGNRRRNTTKKSGRNRSVGCFLVNTPSKDTDFS